MNDRPAAGGPVMETLHEIQIYRGSDPFTPPQISVKRQAFSIKIKRKFLESRVWLQIDGPAEDAVSATIADCMQTDEIKNVISEIVEGYVTGGSDAVTAGLVKFSDLLTNGVATRMSRSVPVDCKLKSEGIWSPWK